ncbi:UDP-4-amino-4,6-dideoxy-N-acetyl-beta-L-altrosamine transaminase [Myxococcota bacterium]|nr:UDP-4-amino-4,6-dideoxy-N-acetyl-beta-L-altrosamine transaminase [Myxococcota bacterium]
MSGAAGTPAFLPYGRQSIDADDVAAVQAVLQSPFLTQGPEVARFEAALAERTGARYCVAFANATAALHCAVAALDLPPGAEGVTSANTFVASANCLAYNGLVPRFADIDAQTANVTAATLSACVTAATRVLIPVHFAGQPCDMPAIGALARERGLRVIEDAAHAIGSVDAHGIPVGACAHSDMTVFSFHPVKTITTGEGGAVTTNDAALHEALTLLRSHGITKDPARLRTNPGPWHYEQERLGFNYRITDLQCALGVSQLRKLDAFKSRRRAIVSAYDAAFAGLPWLRPLVERPGTDSCFHLYVVRLDFAALGCDRAAVMARLAAAGIGSQVHYIPVYTQPWYRETYGTHDGLCPEAEHYFAECLSLPLYPALTDADVARVVAAVRALGSGA